MKRMFLLANVAVSLLTAACVVPPPGDDGYGSSGYRDYGSPGYGETGLAPLPPVVILDADPYYFQNGYHYHYLNGRWLYSRSRGGPWTDLPRSHYPKEVRHRGGDGGRGYQNNSSQGDSYRVHGREGDRVMRTGERNRDSDFRSRERDRDEDGGRGGDLRSRGREWHKDSHDE
jgi:hypothetical protein